MPTAEQTCPQHPPGLAALLQGVLAKHPRTTPRDLAQQTGIPAEVISSWIAGSDSGAGASSTDLRALAEALPGPHTVACILRAAGRRTPADLATEREQRLLEAYRALDTDKQRQLVRLARAM
ncbi:hypothetical protein [Streptacidiphilus jiangxiensis]|uniref:Uncharacterized protein n=1 Tax=Streptacidiphilus jiangxiensis TaxID=235985 RepID=A0A1H7TKW1_STRJI|nr:hypothetical protein [Streptacidiphilus jiangxiensis]SEL85044.1 hypothetical protein SAMN05414137_11429 [Streptacidiphilus jiangxiensis]